MPQPIARLSVATQVAAALLAAVPALLTGSRLIQDPAGRGLLNPDSAMRLVRLEDILAAHAPLHAVMRDGSGAGTVLHWSHLLDSLLLVLAAPLAPLLGWPDALHWAGLAFGPLCLAGLGVTVAWAAAPVAVRDGRQGWLWLGAFAAGSGASVHGYGMMGVVHHHVLLAVVAALAAGWALRVWRGQDPVAGGTAIGAAAAMGLWLSPEALPFCLLSLGALGVGWLTAPTGRRPALATALLAAGITLATLATLACLADPPGGGLLATEIDRLSLPFVLIGLGAGLVGGVVFATGHRLLAMTVAACLGGGWLVAFPQPTQGTGGLMTQDQAAAFMTGITEMAPIQGLHGVLGYLTGGLFATLSLAVFAWRCRRGPSGPVLLYAAVCVLGAVVLASTHLRFAAYPSVAGAVLLPVVLAAITASAAPVMLQSVGRVGVAAGLLALPLLAPLTATAASRRPGAATSCRLAGAAALLQAHPGAIVLAGVNETPDILYRTPARTVGSLYHRNQAGFMRLRAAWRAIPGDTSPPPELLATGATLVLGCPGEPRSALLDGLPQTTLLDRLIANDPPAWLDRLADAGPGGYVLYGVRE